MRVKELEGDISDFYRGQGKLFGEAKIKVKILVDGNWVTHGMFGASYDKVSNRFTIHATRDLEGGEVEVET